MRTLVTPIRVKGVGLTPEDRRRCQPVKGGVRVMCVQDARMGRATNLVEIHPAMPMQPKPLYDAKLSGMPTSEFVLSRFELVDGSAYAQT